MKLNVLLSCYQLIEFKKPHIYKAIKSSYDHPSWRGPTSVIKHNSCLPTRPPKNQTKPLQVLSKRFAHSSRLGAVMTSLGNLFQCLTINWRTWYSLMPMYGSCCCVPERRDHLLFCSWNTFAIVSTVSLEVV